VSEQVLAVRADEYLARVGSQRFVALPREEIERLYGGVELHVRGRDALDESSGYLPLVTCTAAHYNYTWLTYQRAQRSLGVSGFVFADGDPPLFLAESLQVSARREIERAEALSAPAEWRLAGLINDDQRVGLVYIAKLRQRWSAEQYRGIVPVHCCNNGELRMERDQFEPWSQLLIDNLPSL